MELAQARLADSCLRHLVSVPGIGLITGVAVLAVIGEVRRFPCPNDWSAISASIAACVNRATGQPYPLDQSPGPGACP